MSNKSPNHKSDSYLNSNGKPKLDRTNATKAENVFEEQDELRIIKEKLKKNTRNQTSIEASCDESSIQPFESNTTSRTPLPSAPIKNPNSKEYGEQLPLPVSALAARFPKTVGCTKLCSLATEGLNATGSQ
ncbi:hypothetical protein EAE96_001483 [Botrytis aclada]|nr:hypothetical protein EAE96_001483 [Botrytis aclada]